MAGIRKIYGAIKTVDGTDGALDAIDHTVLQTGDLALVGDNTEEGYFYRYDSDASDTEDDPQVVTPDSIIAPESTDGRWILTDWTIEDLHAYGNVQIDGTLDVLGTITFADLDCGALDFDSATGVAGATIDRFDNDDTFAADSATRGVTQAAVKGYIDNALAGSGFSVVSNDALRGYIRRPQFTFIDNTEMSISSIRCEHSYATGSHWLKMDGNHIFEFGPTGSNPASSALPSYEDWIYIYIDDSTLSHTGLETIDETNFYNTNQAPLYHYQRQGHYATGGGGTSVYDRCIFAVKTDSSGNVEPWHHDGGDYVQINWNSVSNQQYNGYPGNSWATAPIINIDVPRFATCANMGMRCEPDNDHGTTSMFLRVREQNADYVTVGSVVGYGFKNDNRTVKVEANNPWICEVNARIEIIVDEADNDHEVQILLYGWWFPRGM